MQEAGIHHHPRNTHVTMHAMRLERGDIVEPGDVYDRSDGAWAMCHPELIGTAVLRGSTVIILRPLRAVAVSACAQG